jgi:hypothetical protein
MLLLVMSVQRSTLMRCLDQDSNHIHARDRLSFLQCHIDASKPVLRAPSLHMQGVENLSIALHHQKPYRTILKPQLLLFNADLTLASWTCAASAGAQRKQDFCVADPR